MKSEPIRILLNGLAAVVNLILIALVLVHALAWDPAQIAGVVAAIQAVCALLAEVLRAAVVSPATDEQRTADGRAELLGNLATSDTIVLAPNRFISRPDLVRILDRAERVGLNEN